MKKATCRDLRGACEVVITGNTPGEMAENCKKHVSDVMSDGDESHKAAVESMMKLTKEDQQKWYEEFVKNFDSLKDI